jgi:glycosyltransferase involved in cell wall biosynthesis
MRVALATVQVPFVRGGAEILTDGLRSAFHEHGYQAEIVSIPFRWYPPERILDHMLACRLLDITESEGKPIDLLVGLKFPAYLMSHPNKVLWIMHQHRQAYDLWQHPAAGDMAHHPHGAAVKDAIVNADKQMITASRAIFTISHNVTKRLRSYCGIDATTLYHPPLGASLLFCGPPADYFFFPSRILETKRQELVVEALAKTRHPVVVKFAGMPNNAEYLYALQEKGRQLGVATRVQWLGAVSEEEKRNLYAHSIAVVYPPVDEDFGYVTLESMLSAKPIISCTDSGGPLEFVTSKENGIIVDPTPESLAAAMDELWLDRACAVHYGDTGLEKYKSLNISWARVVSALTAHGK